MFSIVLCWQVDAQDAIITINTTQQRKPISPYLYGRNNSFSNVFGSPTTATEIERYQQAGLRFARENNGNNATKYNWKRKLSSHPDWYNNVYAHDWDYGMETIEANMPGLQTMWAFQLIGQVASNNANNFNDWGYNGSQWWEGVAQNLAGGGQVNESGGDEALVEGNPNLYLMDWPADSTTDILNHWFEDLGYDPDGAQYWSMDNEPEIWNGTHDDVMPTLPDADDFLERYFQVAKLARAKFPEIKLVGPVAANEWQWYRWGDQTLMSNGTYYPWLEYFIKRVAEEQVSSGIRLLDVLDIHWYPAESTEEQMVQLHRVFYDESYEYPGANGLKTIGGSWDDSQNKEFIFGRIEGWLDEYFGENHGISLSLSEYGDQSSDPSVTAVVYASILGTFTNNEVEVFTPWTWKNGMWETLHLFSRYAKQTSVASFSSLEEKVSGYSSISADEDSLTVMLVNRDLNASQTVKVNLNGFSAAGEYATLQLSSLPQSETFVSHTNNALVKSSVNSSGGSFEITLPPTSVTAVLLSGEPAELILGQNEQSDSGFQIYPNPTSELMVVECNTCLGASEVFVMDVNGKQLAVYQWPDTRESFHLPVHGYSPGVYFVEVTNSKFTKRKKLVIE